MRTLCIDTAYKMLVVGVIEDGRILFDYQMEAPKRQSESLFKVLSNLSKEYNFDFLSIDSICFTIGPGSYTGTRIALTLAKTLALTKKLTIYTISTLKLYSNMQTNTAVLMDARAERTYFGVYNNGKVVVEDCIVPLSELDLKDYNLIGDLYLIGKEASYPDIMDAFLNSISVWEPVADIASLTPKYLKETEAYKR